ncbi:MAG: TonB-dependent receptor [Tannerellaceae bacterium]|nr:TonB-dependent receptor [Tannerellaceae bacterium]
MKRKIYLSGSLLIVSCMMIIAQNVIQGKIVNTGNSGIDGVAVIVQTRDSVYVNTGITDSLGVFALEVASGQYRLLLQHLLYETKQVDVLQNDIGIVTLIEKDYQLDEVVVKGERPQVKVSGGALIYDIPQLIKNKPVNNAFEAIKELPGISGNDEKIELLGARSLHIVLNGQLTTMSAEQLINLLKSIPASRIKSTEIMYNAPARYNVKGALINVIIGQESDTQGETLQGEAGTEYRQHHYASGLAHANIVYITPQLSIDALVNGSKGKRYGGENLFTRHALKDNMVEIDQENRSKSKSNEGSFRLGMDYTFKNDDKLSVSYYINAGKFDGTRTSNSLFTYLNNGNEIPAFSVTNVDNHSTLQNVRLQYKGYKEVTAGVDFTNYRNPEHQFFVNNSEVGSSIDLLNNSDQDISKWMAFLNHTYLFKNNTRLNYGINGSCTVSDTRSEYLYNEEKGYILDKESSLNDEQIEYGGNVFAELSHTFGRFSATVSLKGEYFKSEYTSNGKKSVLWDDFTLFPNASLSYTFSPSHILQFNLSSNKTYPSYWSVNPQTSYLNAYSVIQGNPSLKPSRSYDGQLLYLLRQKYVFMVFAQYSPDYFVQVPHQSDTELKTIFRFENFDFNVLTGFGVIIPVNIGHRIDSRITIQGIRMQEKSDNFYNIPFNKSKYLGRIGMNNTINISDAKPNMKLTLNGYYVSPAIQGVYNLGSSYDVSGGLKWTFAQNKASLTLKYENIFRSRTPKKIEIAMGDWYSRMKNIDTSWYWGIAFTWKFGGYKEKKHEKIDDSRFGR